MIQTEVDNLKVNDFIVNPATSQLQKRENFYKLIILVLQIISVSTIIILVAVISIMVWFGSPMFAYPDRLLQMVTENKWFPEDHFEDGEYGALAAIAGTFMVGIPALILSIIWGVGLAIFLSEYTRESIARKIQPAVEFVASVPSVIFGMIAFTYFFSWFSEFFTQEWIRGIMLFFGYKVEVIPKGTYLAAAVALAFMTTPIIASISLDAMRSTPLMLRNSAKAFGATKWEIFKTVVYPHSKKTIFASILLGFGRAIGETMVVLMVLGNAPVLKLDLLVNGMTMTSVISGYWGEASEGSSLQAALFVLGLLLLSITAIVVYLASLITSENKAVFRFVDVLLKPFNYIGDGLGSMAQRFMQELELTEMQIAKMSKRRKLANIIIGVLLGTILLSFILAVYVSIGRFLISGMDYFFAPGETSSMYRINVTLRGDPKNTFVRLGLIGLFTAITGTISIVTMSAAISFPVATITGIYLSEFAPEGRLTIWIRQSIININAIPSIVVGLFVYALFSVGLNMGAGILPGSIALSIMMIPIITTNTIEALNNIPSHHMSSAIALGATRWEAFWKHKFPYALPNIFTGYLLGSARVSGETAPLLFTAATFTPPATPIPTNLTHQAIRVLPYEIYYRLLYTTTRVNGEKVGSDWAVAASVVLMLFVLTLTVAGYFVRTIIRRRYAYNGEI